MTEKHSLPNHWRIKPLNEIAEINPRLNKSRIPDDMEVSFVPMSAVGAGDGNIDVSKRKKASEAKKGYTPFKEGDVLFAKITPCMENGKMAVVPKVKNGYGFGSTEFHVLRPQSTVDAPYLYYFVSSERFRREAAYNMTGAVGQKRVPATYLREQMIPIAPLNEQKCIVAEIETQFSRLDEAVASLKRVKANLKRYKAAVLKAAVEGKLTERWRKEQRDVEPASEPLKRILAERKKAWEEKSPGKKYKEPVAPDTSTLPELPEGWVWATVEQIADVGTGATPLRSKRVYYDSGKVPWITSGALNEEFISEPDEYITDLAVQETNAKLFPAHALLVAMYGEGKTRGKVSELLIDATTNQACAAIVFKGRSIKVRKYTKLFFLKNYNDIRRLSSGGVQPNLNLSHIKGTAIPLPPLDEQESIIAEVDRRFSVVREFESQVDANLQRAERLRKSILKIAFSGKLAVEYRSTN